MIRPLLATLLTLLLLAACGGEEPYPIDRPGPQQLPVGELVAVDLPPPFDEGDQLRASFEDGEVSFQATCNTMSGTVALDGDALVVDSLGGTEMGCPGAGFEQDEWLVDFFTSRPTLGTPDVGFSLQSELADLVLLPPEAAPGADDLPLERTDWRLTGIEEADGDSVAMTGVPDGLGARFRIADGELRFSTGCNRGSGEVSIVADTLRIRRGLVSQVGCGVGAEFEGRQLEVLLQPRLHWVVDTDTLRLTRGDTTLLYSAS